MSYCFNPDCQKPENLDGIKSCLVCGSNLLLKEQYRAIKPLGEGGFGRTFLAEDANRLNARCAIKQFFPLPQIQSNPEAMAKATKLFEQEAKQLLKLGELHPQIPTLLAYFEQDKHLYLVQQYIDGQNLSKELAHLGVFSEPQIRQLLNDLLPVLQFVHEHRVVHRDIKPTNILRSRVDGKFVLIDFGIAKHLASAGTTRTGSKPGTEGYAPIEQLRGSQVFPASDLYSLGVTCIHLLTQVELDALYNPIQGDWVWRSLLQQKGRDVSEQLAQVLDKLLKDYVKERYQSAVEVLKDLNSRPSLKLPLPPLRVTPPPPPPPILLPQANTWQCVYSLTGHSGLIRSVAMSPDGKTVVSGSGDKTINLWNLGSGKLLHTFEAHSNWVRCVAFSPQSELLASCSADKTIKLWQLSNYKLIHTLTGHSNGVSSVTFSPDEQTLISGGDDEKLKLWDVSSGNQTHNLTQHSGSVLSVTVSSDGKTIATGCGDQIVRLWDFDSGLLMLTLTGHSGWVRSVAISPNNQIIASGSEDNTIKLWQLDGKLIRTLNGHLNRVTAIAFSPDGKSLISGGGDKCVRIWNLYSGKLVHILKGHSDCIWSVAISADGQTIASGSADNTVKIWRFNC